MFVAGKVHCDVFLTKTVWCWLDICSIDITEDLQSFCRWKSSQRASHLPFTAHTRFGKAFRINAALCQAHLSPYSQNDWINGWSFYFRCAPASLPEGCRSWTTLGAFTCTGVMPSLVNTEREQEGGRKQQVKTKSSRRSSTFSDNVPLMLMTTFFLSWSTATKNGVS